MDSDTYYLSIIRLASKIEGLPRQSGLHAAGVILNETPLEDVLPLLENQDGLYTAQYEMNPLAEQGFLKMDILGLRNLTILDNAIKRVNQNHHLEEIKGFLHIFQFHFPVFGIILRCCFLLNH